LNYRFATQDIRQSEATLNYGKPSGSVESSKNKQAKALYDFTHNSKATCHFALAKQLPSQKLAKATIGGKAPLMD
jgi:hypothetical protein